MLKKIGFTAKMIIGISVLLLLANIVLGFVMLSFSKRAMMALISERMLDVANVAAASIDGDILEGITAEDVGSPEYNEMLEELKLFQNNMKLEYIYGIQQTGEKEFAFLIDPELDDPGFFGEPIEYTDALYTASKGTPSVDKEATSDRWGTFYSAYSPVYNSKGEVAGIIGVDFDAAWYNRQISQIIVAIALMSVFSLFAGALIVFLVTGRIRSEFKLLNSRIGVLVDEVDELNRSLPGSDHSDSDNDEQVDNNGIKVYSGEHIDELNEKIQNMQKDIKRYLEYMKKQAYMDNMTGVKNKTAYLKIVEALNNHIYSGMADFSVAVFDVNGLKSVNDSYGHEAGDLLICGVADCIIDVFGGDRCFRIGGDEFIVIMMNTQEKDIREFFSVLEDNFNKWKNEKYENIRLSAAMGAARYVKEIDSNYNSVFRRADDDMYDNKKKHYMKLEQEK